MNKQVFNFNFSVSESEYNRNTDKANILKYKEIKGDIFLLGEYIKNGYAYTNCFYHDGELFTNREKSSNNVKSANIISIDLDAVKYTYEDFINLMEQSEINPNIVYTTANNGKRKKDEKYTNRYRVIYITDKPIYNNNLYCYIHQNIKREIELITEDKNIFNDNTDKSISHFFAGNINTNIIIDNNIYSLKWLTDRYNINEENTKVDKQIIKENTLKDNNSKKRYISKLISKKIEYIKSITQSYNKEGGGSIIQMCDTFADIEENEFIRDYYVMSISQLINRYISVYPSIESTQLEYKDNEPFIYLPFDYTEIKRRWGYEEIERNGGIINTFHIVKRKDGEHRRKTLFTNMLLRKRIYPNISFCHLLFNAIYELYYYIDNTEDKITKNEIAQIVVNAYFANIEIKNTEIRKYIINPYYCMEHNITKRQCNMLKINNNKNKRKEETKDIMRKLYDESLKDVENLKVLNEHLINPISIASFKRYKKEMELYKNKKINTNNKNAKNTNKERTSAQITMLGQSTTEERTEQQRAQESEFENTNLDGTFAQIDTYNNNAFKEPMSARNDIMGQHDTEDRTEQQSVNKYPFRLICYDVPKFSNIQNFCYVPTLKNYMPFV